MARRPSVRIVNGYWYSEAGGRGRYFGRIDITKNVEALARLYAALAEAEDASVIATDNYFPKSDHFNDFSLDTPSDHSVQSFPGNASENASDADPPTPLVVERGGGVGDGRNAKRLSASEFRPASSDRGRKDGRTEGRKSGRKSVGVGGDLRPYDHTTNAGTQGRKSGGGDLRPYDLTTLRPDAETQGRKAQPLTPHPLSPTDANRVGDERQTPTTPPTLTVDDLRTRYLDWLGRHRSAESHRKQTTHLRRFADAHGNVPATAIEGSHLEAWIETLHAKGYDPAYVRKHVVSVKTMFRRGVKARWLPSDFRPFDNVEGVIVDARPILETDLPTPGEVASILATSHRLNDLWTLYHATGARTHELLIAKVGDFQAASRTIVLARHKRSKTMKAPTPRTIVLNDVAYAILRRRCEGRSADEPVFATSKGNAYTTMQACQRFKVVRRMAKVRETITPYSFRHLWISEALMAGLDSLIVSRMAGTSVAMIEKVYGHFRTSSLADAQARLDAARRQ